MAVFEKIQADNYEQILYCHDQTVGLKAIIAIHNSALGPATGGCRMWNYRNEEEALTDVLRLSKGMTYKASISHLPLGGGKSIIIGDSSQKTPELLRRFGDFVETLKGHYITAKDVGIDSNDLKIIKSRTSHILGIAGEANSSGDPSPVTAWGVYNGILACAEKAFGSKSLQGLHIALQGLGAVNYHLLKYLHQEGAKITGCDINAESVEKARVEFGIQVTNPEGIYDVACDIFSPGALGAVVNNQTIERLKCKVIAGAANNQLANEGDGEALLKRGILYAPDYAINAGGLINIYHEREGYNRDKAYAHVARIYDTIKKILEVSNADRLPANVVANRIAGDRVRERPNVHAIDGKIHLGLHRVIEPAGALPQQAKRLDCSLPLKPEEILIEVSSLNVDSASFHQFFEANGREPQKTGEAILAVIRERGKLQNPVTGSGGMLIGTVAEVGSGITNPDLKVFGQGDRIATLVSLTLTPLHIRKIIKVMPEIERVEVEGHAILFNSGIAAKLPPDLNEGLALAALDVCGAPAQTARLVKPGMNVAVIGGGGKSGLFCLYEARRRMGITGKVVAFEYAPKACERLRKLSFVDEVIEGNAKDAVGASEAIKAAFGGAGADLVINVANVAGTEMSSILATKSLGTVYFFSMATSFSAAALGAEGVAADVTLIIGNGYTEGHAALTLDLLRESEELRTILESLYEARS